MKKLSALAAGSVAIGLLLGTNIALAEEEVCVDGDTVLGIKGLDVILDEYGNGIDPITIDVRFTYATGYEVYGQGLDNFPFNAGTAEEDLIAINAQINASLDAANPTPGSAGHPDQNAYFVGGFEDFGLIGAYGSENLANFWEPCRSDDCILGTTVLEPDAYHTYAELSAATGGVCGNIPSEPTDPPGTSYPINPCISGSWFLLARDGEGYNIEIIGSELDMSMLAYFYTYDEIGNQMWLIAQGPVTGDTAVLPTWVTSGASYGDDFDPADVVREEWGTLTFKFTSHSAGTVERASTMGYGTTTYDITRLTFVTGLACD